MKEQAHEGTIAPVMRAARVHGPGDVRLDTLPQPACGPHDVIVRLGACGVCGSDLSYIAQGGLGGSEPLSQPLPIGHEFAGTVVTVGAEVTDIALGLRVAVNPDAAYIGGGGPEGAMAPYIKVSAPTLGRTIFPLPDHLSFDIASLAEPLSVGLHGLRVAGAKPGDKVAILGAGPIGLGTIVVLKHLGIDDIVIFDRVPERLARAQALGATHTINVDEESLTDALGRVHGFGERFGSRCVNTTLFLDCAGHAPAVEEIVAIAPYRARISIIALHHKPMALDLWCMMANEIALFGSIADNRAEEFGEAVALLAAGPDIDPLISHRIDFSDFHHALTTAADATRAAKVVLTFSEAA
jgi:threonine dehydrogenase-like Zn-dependent dehydrogenase